MYTWKLKYCIKGFITFDQQFEIDNMKFYKLGKNNFVDVEIEDEKDILKAIKIGSNNLDKIIGAMEILTTYEVNYNLVETVQLGFMNNSFVEVRCPNVSISVNLSLSSDKIDFIKTLVDLSKEDENVLEVLEIFSNKSPNSWANLYRIYEKIDSDTNIVKNNWCSKSKINNFKHTANSTEVLGKECRHGFNNQDAPSNPMSGEQAKSLIYDIFQRWIEYKKRKIIIK